MSTLDWILLGFVALTALAGFRSGLVVAVLSFAGLFGGAVAGARVAPTFLSGGTRSDYAPLVALGGALVGAVLLRALARFVGSFVRGGLRLLPPLHLLDSLGGAAVGTAWGFALVWVAGAAALQLPKDTRARKEVRTSEVLQKLNDIAPPRQVLNLDVGSARLRLPIEL